MSSDLPIVSLSGVTKGYKVTDSSEEGRRSLGRSRRSSWFTAVDDVSFDLSPGEVVGLVGANGAGKSTLLKLISRVAVPDRGSITLNGPLMSLLEVGAGFHPELTARENVYLNGAILGMDRSSVGRQFDNIVALAGVGPFLDTPVKRFSSGMRVRLAIAVGLHLDSEAVILDEVLAVGDADFQRRCLEILDAMATEGSRATLLVSHNMSTIRQVCRRVLVMHQGRLVFDGEPAAAVAEYFARLSGVTAATGTDLTARTNPHGDGHLHVLSVDVVDSAGSALAPVRGGPLGVAVSLATTGLPDSFVLAIAFSANDGRLLATAERVVDVRGAELKSQGELRIVWSLAQVPFGQGQYSVGLTLRDSSGLMLDAVERARAFGVIDPTAPAGSLSDGIRLPHVVLEGAWRGSATDSP